jgi:hypothetical protein
LTELAKGLYQNNANKNYINMTSNAGYSKKFNQKMFGNFGDKTCKSMDRYLF